MNTVHPTLPGDPTITILEPPTAGPRSYAKLVLGVAAVVAVAAAVVTVQRLRDDTAPPPSKPAAALDHDVLVRDLVNRGLIPRQALEPAADPRVVDLVERGLVPRQALAD
jgi:hypothetical protein